MKLVKCPGVLVLMIMMLFVFGRTVRAAAAPEDSTYTPLVDYRGFADEAVTPGGTQRAKMVYMVNPSGSGGSTNGSTNTNLDSVKSILNVIMDKLDSLKVYARAETWLTVNGDSISTRPYDSVNCIGTFSQGYAFTITADDTIEVSNTSNFAKCFPMRPNSTSTVWSFTSPYLKATSFPKIFWRRKGASGTPLVDILGWGN